MEQKKRKKILPFEDLLRKIEKLRQSGKVIVQSHGIFDLIHPGIIHHLNSAREKGDLLIVTIIKDKDVRRGPGRPIFPETLRAENVASLQQVDYVALVDDSTPFQCLEKIKPHIFAKGQTYMGRDRKIHDKIFAEGKDLYFGKTRIVETEGFSFSSTKIIKDFLDIYPEETKEYLRKFSQKYSFNDIERRLGKLKNMKALLIGDGIIDEYHYCSSMGKSSKANLVVSKYLADEVFAGGAFAIANHMAGLCGKVHLVTLLGDTDNREDFIRGSLKSNVDPKFFYRKDGPTIVKKRYINQYLNQKIFEVNYLNDDFIGPDEEREIVKYLKEIIPDYDVILVSDFGHGFMTGRIIKVIERLSRRYAVNTQTNAANAGFNMITRYHRPYFICLDEAELRLAAQARFDDIEKVAVEVAEGAKADCLIATLGKSGSIAIAGEKVVKTPVFSSKVVDTVGAGDAFFAFTAPCLAKNLPLDLVNFIGNAVGAIAVQIVGNKRSVEKYELLEFVHALLEK